MTDAEKREKAIRGLECCKWSRQNVKPEKNKCDECPYKDQNIMNAFTVWKSCTNVLAGDALALLRKQEPQVLEYSEIEKHPLVWLEDNDRSGKEAERSAGTSWQGARLLRRDTCGVGKAERRVGNGGNGGRR